MGARVADLADAVVALLNGNAAWSQGFTAERGYLPRFELSQLSELRVVVVPKSDAEAMESRSTVRRTIAVDVGVIKQLSTEENADMDAMMLLTDQIKDYVRGQRFSSLNAMWSETTNDPVYDPTHLRDNRTFFAVITFNFLLLHL